jgi:hypothetical protein
VRDAALRAFCSACAYAARRARARTATTGTTSCASSRARGPAAIFLLPCYLGRGSVSREVDEGAGRCSSREVRGESVYAHNV